MEKLSKEKRYLSQAISECPLEFQPFILAENAAWSTSELLGQIGELSNKTAREIVEIHFRECEMKSLLLKLAYDQRFINEITFLEAYFNHKLFISMMHSSNIWYQLEGPVKHIVLSNTSVTGEFVEAQFKDQSGESHAGYLQCNSGLIFQEKIKSYEPSSCYLPLVKLGGLE